MATINATDGILTLATGGDRRKNPETRQYRYMTKAECLALGYGDHIYFVGRDGTARTARVNGQVRTWKRDANRIELPIKYGMYEYATFYFFTAGRHYVAWDDANNCAVTELRPERIGNDVATAIVPVR